MTGFYHSSRFDTLWVKHRHADAMISATASPPKAGLIADIYRRLLCAQHRTWDIAQGFMLDMVGCWFVISEIKQLPDL